MSFQSAWNLICSLRVYDHEFCLWLGRSGCSGRMGQLCKITSFAHCENCPLLSGVGPNACPQGGTCRHAVQTSSFCSCEQALWRIAQNFALSLRRNWTELQISTEGYFILNLAQRLSWKIWALHRKCSKNNTMSKRTNYFKLLNSQTAAIMN